MKNYDAYVDEDFMDSDASELYHGGKVKIKKKKTKIKDDFSKQKTKKLNKPKHINKNDN